MAERGQELPLRVTVLHPPAGVDFAVQLGTADLLTPTDVKPEVLTFDFSVRVDSGRGSIPRLLGQAVQGPPAARFVYVNSGARAGQKASCWDRRAKVPLTAITWEHITAVQKGEGSRLEARIEGTARDGGPSCATVALLEGGWRLVSASRTRRRA